MLLWAAWVVDIPHSRALRYTSSAARTGRLKVRILRGEEEERLKVRSGAAKTKGEVFAACVSMVEVKKKNGTTLTTRKKRASANSATNDMKFTLLTALLSILLSSVASSYVDDSESEQGNLRASRDLLNDDLDPNPNVWIVEFHAGTVGAETISNNLAKANKGKVGHVFQHGFDGFVYHGTNAEAMLSHPNVRAVTRDSISSIASQTIPTGISRIFADTKAYMKNASASCYCDAVVAVLDTGVDFTHPDLRVNTAMSIDCSRGGSTCIQGAGNDDNGHGTHVAGTIAAMNNALGVVGVCPGAEIWSIKVLNSKGNGYLSWILLALEYVIAHGSSIDVVNMSLSGPGCGSTYCSTIARAKQARVAFAVAAGNEKALASGSSPACCAAVLAVSALGDSDGKAGGLGPLTCNGGKDDAIAAFSNYGQAVDMAAPGGKLAEAEVMGVSATEGSAG
jgi:hypothetical protein